MLMFYEIYRKLTFGYTFGYVGLDTIVQME